MDTDDSPDVNKAIDNPDGQLDDAALQGSTFRLFMDAKASFPFPPAEDKTSTATWASSPRVAAALRLLNHSEQAAVRRYLRPSDAALSLCSCLLKHLAIVRACSIPWADSTISQERHVNNGKPYFKGGGVEFNVSHHGEIVALVATSLPRIHVGIDVVQVDTARDRRGVDKEGGFESWVKIFRDVFSESEFEALQNITPVPPGLDSDGILRLKLRRFHLNWALKEAYIKMTGDALMAQWLQELEFTSTVPPQPPNLLGTAWAWGQTAVTGVKLHGNRVEGVRLEIDALNEDYMVATAINHAKALPKFEQVILSDGALSLDSKQQDRDQMISFTPSNAEGSPSEG